MEECLEFQAGIDKKSLIGGFGLDKGSHLVPAAWMVILAALLSLGFASCMTSTDNPPVEKPPKAPTNLVATAISHDRIGLVWDDNSTDETEFRIERRNSENGNWAETRITVDANSETYADAGLVPGTRYYYRVWAFSSNGGSTFSNTAAASTLSHLEAEATFDQSGGTLVVTEPTSPTNGTKIFVPTGTVSGPTSFSITDAVAPDISLPADVVQDGPMITLASSSPLASPVLVEFPFPPDGTETELRLLFQFREGNQSWELVEPLPGPSGDVMRIQTQNLSTYARGRAHISQNTLQTGFSALTDPLRANNTSGGSCLYSGDGPSVGFSLIAEEYYRNFATPNSLGLKCWWSDVTSYNAACQAQALFQNGTSTWEETIVALWAKLGIPLTSALDGSFLAEYWKRQLADNHPIPVLMVPTDSLQGHSALIVGWQRTDSLSGKFLVYENQDNTAFRNLNYLREGIAPQSVTTMNYADTTGDTFELFADTSVLLPDTSSIHGLVAATPRDFWDPCGSSDFIRIAFSAAPVGGAGDLYLLVSGSYLGNNFLVSQLTLTPAGEDSPCWSPDGNRIAYSSDESGKPQVWIMNADGTNPHRLTDTTASGTYPVAWSLDGKYIYTTGNSFPGDGEVAKVDATTGAITLLTNVPGYNTQYFDLNPSQTKIAFVRGYEGNGYSNQLYLADFPPAGVDFANKVVFSDVMPAPHYGKFSPDGNRIAVHLDQADSVHGIGIVNVDGSGFFTPVPVQNGIFACPDWIDNNRIIFIKGDVTNQYLNILDLRYPGQGPLQLALGIEGSKGSISVFKPRT